MVSCATIAMHVGITRGSGNFVGRSVLRSYSAQGAYPLLQPDYEQMALELSSI